MTMTLNQFTTDLSVSQPYHGGGEKNVHLGDYQGRVPQLGEWVEFALGPDGFARGRVTTFNTYVSKLRDKYRYVIHHVIFLDGKQPDGS